MLYTKFEGKFGGKISGATTLAFQFNLLERFLSPVGGTISLFADMPVTQAGDRNAFSGGVAQALDRSRLRYGSSREPRAGPAGVGFKRSGTAAPPGRAAATSA